MTLSTWFWILESWLMQKLLFNFMRQISRHKQAILSILHDIESTITRYSQCKVTIIRSNSTDLPHIEPAKLTYEREGELLSKAHTCAPTEHVRRLPNQQKLQLSSPPGITSSSYVVTFTWLALPPSPAVCALSNKRTIRWYSFNNWWINPPGSHMPGRLRTLPRGSSGGLLEATLSWIHSHWVSYRFAVLQRILKFVKWSVIACRARHFENGSPNGTRNVPFIKVNTSATPQVKYVTFPVDGPEKGSAGTASCTVLHTTMWSLFGVYFKEITPDYSSSKSTTTTRM